MALADMGEETAESGQDEAPEGYMIMIHVTPQGFEVIGPEPLPAMPQGDEEPAESLPDMTTALKHVLAIYKENPVTEDANAQMKAGYDSA